jgi:hypothetical protein
MKARSLALKITVAALALTASSLWAQDGLEGALSRARLTSPAHLGAPFIQTLAAADFDGDNKPDGALLVDYGWPRSQSSVQTIDLHFTRRGNAALSFESNETTLSVLAMDVNGDGATDIVVEQPFTHKRLHVWLNDRRGGFRGVRAEDFPSAAGGKYERLQSLSQRRACQALCLSPQHGSDLAFSTACMLADRSSSAEQALPFESTAGSCAVASHSPRSPPPPHSR